MVAFICVIIWIIVTPCIAVICGLPLKKEKSQRISWKRYSTCMLLVSVFTFFFCICMTNIMNYYISFS